MQTNFTAEQLQDPRMAEAESILRRCVHCGLCTATCSTYVLVGDERDSPRGRIYLMKDMFESGSRASPEVQHHVDRCLSCLSCMTTCPGGVDYMHLVDLARTHIEKTGTRTFKERIVRRLLAETIPYPDRFRKALWLAALGRPFVGLMKRFGLKEMAAMVELAPRERLPAAVYSGPGTAATKIDRRKRVILLAGCAQQVLRPDINDATIRLLAGRGVDVEIAAGAGCCGALVHHMGREEQAVEQAKRNIDAWVKVIAKGPVDGIIVNASGCGTMVKDYGHLLKNHQGYARAAAEIAEKACDITEFLTGYKFGAPKRWSSLRIAYHSSCSMQHGQRITDAPKALLRDAGFTVLDVPEGHICCGSAGVYNILQPELAQELGQRKAGHIESVRPDIIAAGNLGCITQIAQSTPIPIVHTVELLDWAYGGPIPRGLERFRTFVKDVQMGRAPTA